MGEEKETEEEVESPLKALPKEKPSPAKSTVKKLFHEGKEEDTSGSEKVGKVNDAEQRPMLIDDTQVPKEKHGKKLMEEKVGEKLEKKKGGSFRRLPRDQTPNKKRRRSKPLSVWGKEVCGGGCFRGD